MISTEQISNQPVRFLGRQPFVRMPILSLEFIQAQGEFETERDLATAPIPISGGLRKALHREQQAQSWALRSVPRRIEQTEGDESQGIAYHCPRYWCRHMMLFDMTVEEAVELDWSKVKCDKCGSIGGKPPPSRWERVLG